MSTKGTDRTLQDIPVESIDVNPENPRLVFRQGELDDLMESIRLYGVQVPIAVYKSGRRYILIDGERRWRCCRKLNKDTIPALIQPDPGELDNLLLMFNIHSLREQWDLLTIALKLPKVKKLLKKTLGHDPGEKELSAETGLPRGVIRRCGYLMYLPDEFKNDLLAELNKPKPQQRITEDLFIEMERSLKTVERAMPQLIPPTEKDRIRRVLIEKYEKDVIKNVVHFRYLGKMVRAEKVGDETTVAGALKLVFCRNDYSLEDAYNSTVAAGYSEQEVLKRIEALVERLTLYEPDDLDGELRNGLKKLVKVARKLLEGE